MKISVIGSTKAGYTLPKDEAVIFSGKAAGICYMPDDLQTLFSEPVEKTLKRANGNIVSGHHSVFGHVTYNLAFENIPKILAMVLNNEKIYNTSEKSARYTKMTPSPEEKALYEKWIEIYSNVISEKYPDLNKVKVKKLAQENARCLISVFTPATTMEYTVNFGQLNYIICWAEDYIANEPDTPFSVKLKEVFKEFLKAMPDLKVEGLNSDRKHRKFSLFADRSRREEFGENYSINYMASFSHFAQAQRHRTLHYEIQIPDKPQYFVPPVIKGTELEKEWLKDISSLEEFFPQGMLVKVNERGTPEDLIQKCTERLCGEAQLEIMLQTKKTMAEYIKAVKDDEELKPVYEELLPYSKGARCTFPGWKCDKPCYFGPKNALNREI